MTRPALYLFDDRTASGWDPFSLTRPVGELLFGVYLLRERAEAFWKAPCLGHLTHPLLAGFNEPGSPPVLDPGGIPDDAPRIVQSSRAAPWGVPAPLPDRAATLFLDGQVVGWYLPPGTPGPGPDILEDPRPLGSSEPVHLKGRLLENPWDLMAANGEQVAQDIPRFFPGYAADDLPGCHLLGDGLLSLGSGVEVEPGSVFDLREGPIRLADGVVVRSHTRLEGPAFVGQGSRVLGGAVSNVSIGPVSRIRGEVEASVILGYTNKAHDGFLGHSYVGRWANMGAFTTNSDLKNNYGPVRVGGREGPRATGLMKVGCFLGDHVKTGIGTLLNTGSVVGAGSNLFGGKMPPLYVPPFSWGAGDELQEYRIDKFLEVAAVAMGRRGLALDSRMEALFRRVWEAARPTRDPTADSGQADGRA